MNGLLGVRAPEVVRVLRERRAQRGDHRRKLALVVEGGGMRGVLSAGSLLALDLLGFRDVFDEIYATSAGAVNAAYFLSGQGRLGITVYFDSLCTRRFINAWRVTKIVDVAYAYDQVVTYDKPLDEAAIRRSGTAFYVSLTNAVTGKNELVDARKAPGTIPTLLKASSALPVLYNQTVLVGGTPYVDGGLSNVLPLAEAIARGNTDVLVLLTRPQGHLTPRANALFRSLFFVCMGWKYPRLQGAYRTIQVREQAGRVLAGGVGVPDTVNIAAICPSSTEAVVTRTTMDRRQLVTAAHQLGRKTCRIFGGDEAVLDEVFGEFG